MDSASSRHTLSIWGLTMLFLSIFMMMFIALGFIQLCLEGTDMGTRGKLLAVSALQGIMVFIFPSLAIGFIECKRPFRELGLAEAPSWKSICGILIIYVIGIPALNQLIYWNSNISFPPQFAGLEQLLREWENNSTALSETILSGKSFTNLLTGLLVVSILTGFSEELFFRAGLQRLLGRAMPANAAVWIAALIFSAMHLQFFGFIPRLILGAFFGYLYLWTKSIWVPVAAHSLNNGLVVITGWLASNGVDITDIDEIGVAKSGYPFIFLISCILLSIFFIFYKQKFFKSQSDGTTNIP